MNPLTQALWLFEIEVWKLSFIRTSTRYSFSQCISKVPNRSEHTHDRMNHLKQCCCIQQQMTHDGIKSSATDLCLYPMKAWKLGTLPNKHELKSRQSFTTFREELPVVCYLVSWSVAQHNKVDMSVVNSDRGDHVKLWHLGGTVMREFVSVQRDLHFITASMNLQ